MQGRHILLLILLAASVVAGGCTAAGDAGNAQPVSPTPTPAPTEVQAVGAGLPAPTPAGPVRGDKMPLSVEFVDPQTYHIATPTPTTTMMKPPENIQVSGGMTRYARVACTDLPSVPSVLATEVYHIPFPYWAVNVSATPIGDYPWLAIEIHEKDDPNRDIKTIRYSRNDFPYEDSKFKEKKEQFTILEGYGDYYFIVRSGSLKALEISILVPEKYLV